MIPGSGAATTMDLGPIGDGDPAVDAAGQLFVANPWQIFRVDLASGQLEVFAGTGVAGFAGDSGPPLAAQFDDIGGLAFTPAGALLVSDVKNSRIRSISASGILVREITFDNTALVAISCGSRVTAATGNVTITGNLAATSIDCGSVITVGGSIAVTTNTSATTIDPGGAVSTSGNIAVTNNTSATTIDLGALVSTSGNIAVTNNTSAGSVDHGALVARAEMSLSRTILRPGASTSARSSARRKCRCHEQYFGRERRPRRARQHGRKCRCHDEYRGQSVDLGALTSAGGSVSVDGNTSVTGIELASLTVVNGDPIVSENGSWTTVTLGALTAVTGNLTLESCGIGTFTPVPAAAGGNATVATALVHDCQRTTANCATAISNAPMCADGEGRRAAL